MTPAQNLVRIMRQGRPDFSVGLKLQSIWGLREASVFSLEGIAATFMVISATATWLPGMIVSEAAMILAVLLLFSHLGNPWAAWRAIANIRRSWMSRGTFMIGAFVGLGVLALAFATFIPVPPVLVQGVYWLQIVAAVFIIFYPGFAMAASAGIPFWNTGLLPVLSGLGGLSTGLMAAIAMNVSVPLLPVAQSTALIAAMILVGAVGICVIAMISAAVRMGKAAKLSATRMVGHEWLWFWGLTVGAGIILPAVLLYCGLQLSLSEPVLQTALLAAAALRLLGDIAFRNTVLRVGAYEALL